MFICLILTSFCVVYVNSHSLYYWRDYNGIIPEDAFPGGKDSNENDVYIAQIYCHGHGLFLGTIFNNSKTEIEYACHGPKKASKVINVLCTQYPERFRWLRTTAATVHVDTLEKHVVLGGYDQGTGIHGIGRIIYNGSTRFGVVVTGWLNNAVFYFASNNVQRESKNYEVLVVE